ncbi:MAG: hypothetical protein PHY77_07800, partial [Desulfotomaculaceae bacterium]|nr:hypothetical protein [Desulfotomaculaceae bacterium]
MDQTLDIIGYPLDAALHICKAAGYEIEIMVTRPIRAIPEGNPRVVCFNKVSKNRGVVIVVLEDRGR